MRIRGKKFWGVEGVSWNYGWDDFEWRNEDGPITEVSQREKLRLALEEGSR